jgi:hypothetical protein
MINSPLEMARRAHALLADKFPPARVRHKPLSILRQEGRRALDQLFEADYPTLPKPDRDRMVEDILGEATGFGPLEELFRDDLMTEIMVLGASVVIGRKNDSWVPTSVRFRDAGQVRGYLHRLAEIGEHLTGAQPASGGFDVRMPNGFRVIGVLPPEILDQPPTAVFVRGEVQAAPPFSPTRSGTISNPARQVPGATGSTAVPASAATRSSPVLPSLSGNKPGTGTFEVFSGPLPMPATRVVANPPERPMPTDPYAQVRQRVTERIVRKCAAAGVYDLRQVSTPELQRIILAHMDELNGEEKLGMDEPLMQRLTLEILGGMSR